MNEDVIEGQIVSQSSALVVREESAPQPYFGTMRPAERVALATEMADAIKDVIVKRGWVVTIPGKNGKPPSHHVEVEGWQFCASLAGATAKVTSTTKTANGWEAHAEVVRVDSGIVLGAGDGMCSRDEKRWQYAEDYALRSMAQTRACSRALRHVFSFIFELAGYKPTPAEEMPTDPPPANDPEAEHARGTAAVMAFCKKHNINDAKRYEISEKNFAKRSTKDLTVPQLRELYAALTQHVKERENA